jgi:hypothetical protein
MRQEPVPVRLVDFLPRLPLDRAGEILSSFAVTARVRLCTDRPLYPIRHARKVIYPTGEFTTVLSTPALQEALRRGHVVSIAETAVYEKAVIFAPYVEYFHALKEEYEAEGNRIMRYLTKKLLNALYGKWAQKRPLLEDSIEMQCDGYAREEVLDLVTGHTEIQYQMLNRIVHLYGEEDTEQTFTAISAHITEAARMYLWSLLEPFYPDRILYCDTDSLKIRRSDLGHLTAPISDRQLGALKVEDEFERFEIHGPKAYQTERQRVIKGIPERAEQIGPVSYRYMAFLKQATHQRARQNTGVLTRPITKILRGRYDKGIVLANGRIVPFHVSDEFPLAVQLPASSQSRPVLPDSAP